MAILGVYLTILLFHPLNSHAQNNKDDKNKRGVDEWKEIFKVRNEFAKNQNGSRYVLGVFDGRFIGPNNEDNYGIRTFTTAYDYLIFGNSLLSMLVNFGFTADNINFISSKDVNNHHPFSLGCIYHYTITEEKTWVDSSYNKTIGKYVAVDKPFKSTIPHLGIDSAQVKSDLAGFYFKKKVDNKAIFDTIILPQIEGTGSWKDANNFDMAYEWLETFFLQFIDSIDVTKRQFSKKPRPKFKK